MRDADAEAEIVAELLPFGGELDDPVAHLHRHLHAALARIGAGHRIVEQHHQSVAGEALQGALEGVDDAGETVVVLAQHGHHLLGLGGLGEGGEAAQVAEHDGDVLAVAVEQLFAARRHHQLGDLRREESLQPRHALDLAELLGDALLEVAVHVGDLVVQLLEPQHGFDPRHQRHLVDRLGEIFVGAGLEPGHDVLGVRLGGAQDDRHERQRGIVLEPFADFDAVDLRHHDVEQDQVGEELLGGGERLLAVAGLPEFVALRPEPRHQDVAVGLVVVDDQDTRRAVHESGTHHFGKLFR